MQPRLPPQFPPPHHPHPALHTPTRLLHSLISVGGEMQAKRTPIHQHIHCPLAAGGAGKAEGGGEGGCNVGGHEGFRGEVAGGVVWPSTWGGGGGGGGMGFDRMRVFME